MKICGITSVRDALAAVRFGADAVGLIFARESPRVVRMKQALEICRAVGPWTATVGVFVNDRSERIRRVATRCRLTAVQLHGEEPPFLLRELSGLRAIKVFHVTGPLDENCIERYDGADAYLFDSCVGDARGGTGRRFPWIFLKGRRFAKPVILSGGLSPQNITAAVRGVRPYGVDVSSGVEDAPGRKNLARLKEFIVRAKNA